MNEAKDLKAEAEIEAIKSDWENVVCDDTQSFRSEEIKNIEEQEQAWLINHVVKSLKTGHFYMMAYLDPGSFSRATLKDANCDGPRVYQVYPYQEVITSYKREKPEVSK